MRPNVEEYMQGIQQKIEKLEQCRRVCRNILDLRKMSDGDVRLSNNRVNTGVEEDGPLVKNLREVRDLARKECYRMIAYNRFERTFQAKVDSRKLTSAEYLHFAITDPEILLREMIEKYGD